MIVNAGKYQVNITEKIFVPLEREIKKAKCSSIHIICDENTLQHCVPFLVSNCPSLKLAEIIEIESGESSKCIEVATGIWDTLLANGAARDALIINAGGGVVTDLGGFCASVYKRGISFINVPTSLLAMADAAVGSKTAIDHQSVKNVIGTFAEPRAVFANPDFLPTLPERHIKNGFAEILKMALIADKHLWEEVKNGKLKNGHIQKAVSLKVAIVSQDKYDKGKRKALNYGHTAGHALEALGGGQLLHGEAVVAGMIIENYIASDLKILKPETASLINNVLRNLYPDELPQFNATDAVKFLQNDKKIHSGKYNFSLLNGIGKCRTDVRVTEKQFMKACEKYHSLL
jgi:3-dehydroquinate synthase